MLYKQNTQKKMYKLITTIILSSLIICNSSAQEKLVKRNGDTLAIKLIELNEKYVLYNKTVLADERVFTTSVSKITTLIYADGTILNLVLENNIVIKNGQAESIIKSPYPTLYVKNGFWGLKVYSKEKTYPSVKLKSLYHKVDNEEAEQLFRKGRNQNILANVIGIPSGFTLGGLLGRTITRQETNSIAYVASAFGTLVSMWISNNATKNIKKSVVSYNESIITRIGVSKNGIGIILDF